MECPCLKGLPGIILTGSKPPPPIIISLVNSKDCGTGEARQEDGVEEEDIAPGAEKEGGGGAPLQSPRISPTPAQIIFG